MYLQSAEDVVTIQDTLIEDNTITGHNSGGGINARLSVNGPGLVLDRVVFSGNTATFAGSALAVEAWVTGTSNVEMTNVLVSSNLPSFGSAVFLKARFGSLVLDGAHMTWADHPNGTALSLIDGSGGAVEANLVNALIDSASTAFAAEEQTGAVTLTHTNTLTNNVANLHVTDGGSPTFVANNPLTGDPLLDSGGRLLAGSAAIDVGVDAGVAVDRDGEIRPSGAGFDVGADEFIDSLLFSDGFEGGDTTAWS